VSSVFFDTNHPVPCLLSPVSNLRYPLHMVLIFGKNACPYTQAARDHYAAKSLPFEYLDVKKNAADLERMLVFSKGTRKVPVIVDGENVTIGFGGT
jgi:glutaredoxin 3